MSKLGQTFSSTPFPSINAVGSEILTRLHEYIDCGTHRRAPNNSSIKLLNVRVLDFVGGCLLRASVRCHFSWSLPLALKLDEHFMSTSMVTLTRAFSILVRQAALDDDLDLVDRLRRLLRPNSEVPEVRTINIKIF